MKLLAPASSTLAAVATREQYFLSLSSLPRPNPFILINFLKIHLLGKAHETTAASSSFTHCTCPNIYKKYSLQSTALGLSLKLGHVWSFLFHEGMTSGS